MNKLLSLSLLSWLILTAYSCCDKNIPSSYSEPQVRALQINKLPERFYLKNRMNNCEDKIKYMQSIVSFPEGKEGSFFSTSKNGGSVLGSFKSYIYAESDTKFEDDLEHFYFDFDCFENEHYSTLLPVLMPPQQYERVDQFLKNIPNNHFVVEAGIHSIISFTFTIDNNLIQRISKDKTKVN